MNCLCGHPLVSHSDSAASKRPGRFVQSGCLAEGCGCGEFRGAGADNGATMDAALIARRFAEFRRAYRALESCLKAQGIDLKSE
jgi:hypothetical protein